MQPRLLLLLSLCLCLCASTWASAKPRTKSNESLPHKTINADDDANIFNLEDYGSVGDGVADDGPALQRALNAAVSGGGGTIYVPAGRYAIVTPVIKDFSNIPAAQITIKGVESSTPVHVDGNGREQTAGLDLTSEFVIKTGEAANALKLSGLASLLIKDLVFIGTLERVNDALVSIALSDIGDARSGTVSFMV